MFTSRTANYKSRAHYAATRLLLKAVSTYFSKPRMFCPLKELVFQETDTQEGYEKSIKVLHNDKEVCIIDINGVL